MYGAKLCVHKLGYKWKWSIVDLNDVTSGSRWYDSNALLLMCWEVSKRYLLVAFLVNL